MSKLKYILILINMLIMFTTKLCESKKFIKGNLFKSIGDDLEINELSVVHEVVTSFLGTCTLTSSFEVRGLGECIGRCMSNTQCMALSYARDVGCMLCLPIELDGTGNGVSSGLRHTFVSIDLLKAINRSDSGNLRSNALAAIYCMLIRY